MLYLIVSDSHGDRDILCKLVKNYTGKVDAMFHCGDSELKSDDELFDKMIVVGGNCDYDPVFLGQAVKQVGPDRMLLVHGHLLGVGFGLNRLDFKMQEEGCGIAFFGHTHQLGASFNDERLMINPGSISFPRGKYASIGGTYALLETDEDYYRIQYYDRDMKPIKELKVVFERGK